MGTLFFHDSVQPTLDSEARSRPEARRQIEIFTFSGEEGVNIRIGDLDDLNMGSGNSVLLTRQAARDFLKGLEQAMARLRYDED